MEFKTINIGGGVEILAANDYIAVEICMQNSANVYKAGTPVTTAGAAALDGTGAYGILLYDVDTSINPNGAVVISGVVDYNKIVANAGVTADVGTLQSAMVNIYFKTNGGVNPVMTADETSVTVAASGTDTVTITNAVGSVTVVSSASTKATAVYSSGTLTVTGVAEGSAVITLTDAIGNTVEILVTVTAAAGGSGAGGSGDGG